VCTTEISTKLVVQSSLNHGLSRMFSDILSFGEGSEIYRVRLAKRFAGKEYFEVGAELMREHRISLLAIESDGSMRINPKEPVRVKEGDMAFVLAEEHPREIEER
jgi:voltage-gated potassium channel